MPNSKYFDFESIEGYINKLDKYFPNLKNSINKKMSKDETFSFDSISKAFISENNLFSMTEKFSNYFSIFDELLRQLDIINKENKVRHLPEYVYDDSTYKEVENSLVKFQKFRLYNIKNNVLKTTEELLSEEEEPRYRKLMTDLHDDMLKLKEKLNKSAKSNTEFLKNDIEKLEKLPTKYEKMKNRYWWLLGVTFVIGVSFLVTGLVLWK